MKDVLILSLKNIKAYKKFYIQFVVILVCMVFMISLFSVFSVALSDKQNELAEKSISANYFISNNDNEFDGGKIDAKFESLEIVKNTFLSNENLYSGYGSLYNHLIKIKFNGKIYTTEEYGSFEVFGAKNNNFFTSNDYKEAKVKYGNTDFITGNFPQNNDEIVLSSSYLAWFGIGEEVLGNVIDFVSVKTDSPVITGVKVVGILNDNYCSLVGHQYSHYFHPIVIAHIENDLFKNSIDKEKFYIYDFENWPSEDLVSYLQKEYNAQYIGYSVMSDIQNITAMKEVANVIFLLLGCTLLIGLMLVVYLVINKFAQMFYRNSGILLANGMSRRKLYLLLLLQLLWVSLLSFVIAIIFTICGFYILKYAMSTAFSINLPITFMSIVAMLGVAIAGVVFFVAIIYAFIIYRLKNKNVSEFLKN